MGGNNDAKLKPIAVLILDVNPKYNNKGTIMTSAPPPNIPPIAPTINPIIPNINHSFILYY